MSKSRPKRRRGDPQFRERLRALEATVDALTRTTEELSRVVWNLNGTLATLDNASRAITEMLVTQHVALRDLLVRKGLVTAEEALAAAQIADLERMLEPPADPPQDETPK